MNAAALLNAGRHSHIGGCNAVAGRDNAAATMHTHAYRGLAQVHNRGVDFDLQLSLSGIPPGNRPVWPTLPV